MHRSSLLSCAPKPSPITCTSNLSYRMYRFALLSLEPKPSTIVCIDTLFYCLHQYRVLLRTPIIFFVVTPMQPLPVQSWLSAHQPHCVRCVGDSTPLLRPTSCSIVDTKDSRIAAIALSHGSFAVHHVKKDGTGQGSTGQGSTGQAA